MSIKKSDIAEKDLFGDIGKSARENKGEVDLLNDTLKIVAQTAKQIKSSIPDKAPGTSTELKKQNELVKDANLLANEKIKLDNQLIKAEVKLEATTKKHREEIAKTRLENSRLNKEAKKSAELQDDATGAYRKATIRLADLKRELKDAAIAGNKNEQSVKELRDEYDKLNHEVREADQELGDFSRNVGNYSSALDGLGENVSGLGEGLAGVASGGTGGFGGLGNSISGAVGKLGPWGAAVGAAIGGAVALGDAVSDIDKEFDELRGTIEQLTGLEGGALDSLTASIKAFETTFGAETNESLRAANVLMREFGLSGGEAAGLIEQGFLSNANIQGDLLESITEYSTQIKAAGGDADDLFKVLDASGTAGVFSDKGIDTVKEFGLRIREQAASTSEALKAGFGEEFTKSIFDGINSGSLSTIDALQLVTEKLETSNLAAKDRQTIIADVFGGAGEDAVGFLETLTEINFETEFAADLSGELAKNKQLELEANEALAAAQNRLSKSIENNAALGRAWINIQTIVINKLVGVINFVDDLIQSFEKLKTDPIRGLQEISKAITDLLLWPINQAIDASNSLIGLFSDFKIPNIEFPLDELNEFTAAQRELNEVARLSQKGIEKLKDSVTEYIGEEQKRLDLVINGNISQEERNALIEDLNSKYPELLDNYDLENLSQEDAIELNKQLQIEITNTAILKQKSLALSILENRTIEEQAKINLITNKAVRDQKQKELDFEVKRQLRLIDLIEEETRIKLGLKEREVEELNDLEEEIVKNKKATNSKLEKEEKRHKDNIRKIDIEAAKKRKLALDLVIEDRVDPQIAIDKRNAEKKKKEDEARKAEEKALKESAQRRNEIIEAFTKKALDSIDKRIDKLNDEISAAQKQSDFLQELAANGNIKAEQSLAEQNNIIAEDEAKKAKLEKQKQAIQLISSVVLAYNNELGEGKSTQEALKEALTGTATIGAFIAALPTFMDGIENTGAQGYGVDGKGGFLSVLHPYERVVDKENNALLGDISNNELGEIMNNYRFGSLGSNTIVATPTIDTKNLENKLDGVKNAVENMPKIDIIKLGKTAMMIRETQKRGNFKTTSRIKVN